MVLSQTSIARVFAPVLSLIFFAATPLRAQTLPGANPSPSAQTAAPESPQSNSNATTGAAPNSPHQPPSSKPDITTQMVAELDRLKAEGKLTSRRAVASAVRKVINDNSIQHEIPAPMGAKVIAVHKHPGDAVHVGDKIVTLLVNGKEVPVLAKQDGIMQAINVSKGGVIGNSRPRAAKVGDKGLILLTLKPFERA